MSRHKVKATFTIEYVANTQAYGVVDPKSMADVDRLAFEEGQFTLMDLEQSGEVNVVSWEVGEELVERS